MPEEKDSETKLNDSTTVPLAWLVAGMGASVTAFLLISGAVIWAVRLEARGDYQAEKITKLELSQEAYAKELTAVNRALLEIKFIVEKKKQ